VIDKTAYCTNVTMLCAGKVYVKCPPVTAAALSCARPPDDVVWYGVSEVTLALAMVNGWLTAELFALIATMTKCAGLAFVNDEM